MDIREEIAEHLRTKGVIRCPTVALIKSGVLIPEADRKLLVAHQKAQNNLQDMKHRLFQQGPVNYSITRFIPFVFGGTLTFWPYLV